jgi:hypothetical protein
MIRAVFLAGALGALPFVNVGCASSGSAAKPSGPVELDGTRWKLLTSGGKIDGRVIEYKKKAENRYTAQLIEPGLRLRDVVGLRMGFEMLRLTKRAANEYEGIYIDPVDKYEKEVVVFIDGDAMTWNLQSTQWERQ